MDEKIKNILYDLKFGDRAKIKEAKNKIEFLWKENSRGFDKYAVIFLKEAKDLDAIPNSINQAAFVQALSFSFLSLAGRKYWQELKDFIIKAIIHPNGHVRMATIHLDVWLRCDIGREGTVTDSELQYKLFLQELDELIKKYRYESADARHISEIKPSIYRSLRMLRRESTRGLYTEQIAELPDLIKATQENESFFEEPDNSSPLFDLQAHNVPVSKLE